MHSFEAVLETYNYLGANVVLNGLYNVVTHYGVVAEKPGEVDFMILNLSAHSDVMNVGSMSVTRGEFEKTQSSDESRTRKTPAFTLDSLLESGNIEECPTFIKMVR